MHSQIIEYSGLNAEIQYQPGSADSLLGFSLWSLQQLLGWAHILQKQICQKQFRKQQKKLQCRAHIQIMIDFKQSTILMIILSRKMKKYLKSSKLKTEINFIPTRNSCEWCLELKTIKQSQYISLTLYTGVWFQDTFHYNQLTFRKKGYLKKKKWTLTISHFVKLDIFLNVFCKLYCVTSFTHTQEQDLFTKLEHLVIIW